jgi:hypothetical protein
MHVLPEEADSHRPPNPAPRREYDGRQRTPRDDDWLYSEV